MNPSNNKIKTSIWNKRKGELKNEEEVYFEENDMLKDEENERELIGRIQQRLGVSREEARNIIRNSELI